MNPNSFSSEELNTLSKKNQELFVLDALTDKNQQLVQEAIKEGLVVFRQSLMDSTHKDELVDYRVGNGLGLFPSLEGEWGVFRLQTDQPKGNHWFLFSIASIQQLLHSEALETKEILEGAFEALLNSSVSMFYQAFSKKLALNTVCSTHAFDWCLFDRVPTDEQSQTGTLEWNQWMELKAYQLHLTEEKVILCYHLSDLAFTHAVYSQVMQDSNVLEEEKTMSEKQQPVLNATVGVDDISTPVFAELQEESVTTKKVPEHKVKGLPVEVSVVLGKTYMTIEEISNLSVGRVIPLDKYATDSLEIYVQGELVAYGDPVTIEEKYGAKITKIGDSE